MVLTSQQKGADVRLGEAAAVGEGEGVGAAVQAAAPGALVIPAAQATHVDAASAPAAALEVPAGQGVALKDSGGQKKPAGHSNGAPGAPQKKEAGQGRHVGGEGEGGGVRLDIPEATVAVPMHALLKSTTICGSPDRVTARSSVRSGRSA